MYTKQDWLQKGLARVLGQFGRQRRIARRRVERRRGGLQQTAGRRPGWNAPLSRFMPILYQKVR